MVGILSFDNYLRIEGLGNILVIILFLLQFICLASLVTSFCLYGDKLVSVRNIFLNVGWILLLIILEGCQGLVIQSVSTHIICNKT